MSNQSPKSRRPKGPGEKGADDGLPTTTAPHQSPPAHGSGAGPRVPQHPPGQGFGDSGFGGGVQSGTGTSRPVNSRYNAPAGRPGYAESEDAKRKGGTTARFTKETQ
jgi:hypothetical protein